MRFISQQERLRCCSNALLQAKAQEEGFVFVAPYDDPYTIAGQGTIGNEILRQLSTLDLDNLHALFVAIGGGGLIAGIAAYVKALRPDIKIIGVEPTGILLCCPVFVFSHLPYRSHEGVISPALPCPCTVLQD